MDKKKLAKRLISLIIFIFVINFLATKLYWYYAIWWLDMPMHFLGGFWVGLLYLYFFPPAGNSPFGLVLRILPFVLTIGIGWEIFELFFNNVIATNPFDYSDTVSDLLLDLAGGATAVIYFFRKIMLQ